jgi:hypothetical protein
MPKSDQTAHWFRRLGKKPPQGELAKASQVFLKPPNPVTPKAVKYEVIPLNPEERKQRRIDNKEMKRSRKLHRRRKRHGRPV